jgi:hypothetical protein
MIALNNDNCHSVIYDIVKKSNSCNDAINELCKLKYPNSKYYIKKEEAKFFYEKYSKINLNMKIDKKFTKKAYDMNSKIYKEVHVY